MPAKPFQFVIISDILFGCDKQEDGQFRLLPSRALSLLRYLINKMNTNLKPAFVIQLGNSIEPDDEETDEENFETIVDAFKQLTVPSYHVVGDNEQVNLSQKKLREMLKYEKLYYSFDSGDFHFVVLFASSKDHSDIHIDEAQRKWLMNDLESTAKPCMVFVHHPIDEQDLTDNFWYEKNPEKCFVEERQEVREILARSGKVRVVFSGHVYQNNLEEHDGVRYVSIQSLVRNMSKASKTPSESFAIVTPTAREIRVEIEGNDQIVFSIN